MQYLLLQGMDGRAIPPRRYNKNVLESKHNVIRDIYLRLKPEQQPSTEVEEKRLVQCALRISKDLYGIDLCSSKELTKGYTRPISAGSFPKSFPSDILKAHDDLVPAMKLNRILNSKSVQNLPISIGDLVQLYMKEYNQKQGKWSFSKVVLSYDRDTNTVTVPDRHDKEGQAAMEDVRHAFTDDSVARSIQE